MSAPWFIQDAYQVPERLAAPGCQHQLGCRCPVPYWLRPALPIEEQREAARRISIVPTLVSSC